MKTPLVIAVSLALAGLTAPGTRAASTSTTMVAETGQGQPNAPGQQKRFRATRPIMPDAQTGQWRMPTEQEVLDAVANLVTLTTRPESLPETTLPSNAVTAHLEGGFAGVLLARPDDDGILETRCVFTFEEGAEFLGLVEAAQ